jgi:hypothetical protein
MEECSTYDNMVQGWCYSENELRSRFPNADIDFKGADCVASILASKVFKDRLDPYYYQNPSSPFYKRIFTSLPYVPVAIKALKQF